MQKRSRVLWLHKAAQTHKQQHSAAPCMVQGKPQPAARGTRWKLSHFVTLLHPEKAGLPCHQAVHTFPQPQQNQQQQDQPMVPARSARNKANGELLDAVVNSSRMEQEVDAQGLVRKHRCSFRNHQASGERQNHKPTSTLHYVPCFSVNSLCFIRGDLPRACKI